MAILLPSLLVASLAAVSFPGAYGFKATDRQQCKDDNGICLDSWVWCDESGSDKCVKDTHSRYFEGGGFNAVRMLFWDEPQTIGWINTNDDDPVLLQWSIGASSESKGVSWYQNVTKGEHSFNFTFADLAKDFPTQDYDETPNDILFLASQNVSYWYISQPEQGLDDFVNHDMSSHFLLESSTQKDWLDHQYVLGKSDMNNKWKLGVGIGVGLGVPILMAAMLVLGLSMGKRRATKTVSKLDHQ